MIKRISEIRRLPRLGKIRLGEKEISQKTGREYPKALDYFNCPPEVQAVYGPEPRELDVVLPVQGETLAETIEKIFPQWLKRYGSSKGLICKGDGETAVMMGEDGQMYEIDCNPDECEAYQKKHCRRVASLQFMLPKVPGFGVYQIDTTSFHSIVNLNSCMEMLWGICGRIAGIPLVLKLEPKEVTVDGSKKVVHVLSLTSRLTLGELQKVAKRLALPPVEVEPPSDEMPDDLYPRSMVQQKPVADEAKVEEIRKETEAKAAEAEKRRVRKPLF